MSGNNSNGIWGSNTFSAATGGVGGTSGTYSYMNQQQLNNDEWDNIFDNNGGDDDENNDNNNNNNNYNPYSMRDAIIFLIDCSTSMFEPTENKEIPFNNAIKCLIQTITDKIITSDSDLIGICLYNTEKKKNINDFENIFILFDLDVPDPKIILSLEEILESDFSKTLGHCQTEFPFCDALWTCSTMFSNCNVKQQMTKRIFLFTNEDNPNGFNDSIRNVSLQRAKDLADLGIQIELFSMNKPEQIFDFSLFYQYIIVFGDDEYVDANQFDATTRFSDLKNKLKRKEFKKRSLGKIPLYIGSGNSSTTGAKKGGAVDTSNQIIIATQLYNLVSTATKSTPTQLDPKTNLPVKVLRKNVCLDTGATLLPSQIKYCYYYGGEPIIFSKDELEEIKALDRLGLVLLGFKPRESAIKPYQSTKHASFLFPDEGSIKGSTVAFNALVQQMLVSDKVAICRFTARSNVSPRMVALLPQDEVLSPDGMQIRPRGMHIIYLPYADDIRSCTMTSTTSCKDKPDFVNKAKKIVKSLKIKFDDKKYLNPNLQKHYSNLHALALERDKVEPTVDSIFSEIQAPQELIEDFNTTVFSEGYADRVAANSTTGVGSKRSRDSGKDYSTLNWEDLAKTGNIAKLTVPEITLFLKNQGVKIPSKSKKTDLVDISIKYINENGVKKDKLLLLASPTGSTDDSNNNNSKTTKKTTTKTKSKKSKEDGDGDNDEMKVDDDDDDFHFDFGNQDKIDDDENENDNEFDDEFRPTKKTKGNGKSSSPPQKTTTTTTTTTTNTSNNGKKKSTKTAAVTTIIEDIDDDDDDFLPQKQKDDDDESTDDEPSKPKGPRPVCKYDGSCYRMTNPQHTSKFRHIKQKGNK